MFTMLAAIHYWRKSSLQPERSCDLYITLQLYVYVYVNKFHLIDFHFFLESFFAIIVDTFDTCFWISSVLHRSFFITITGSEHFSISKNCIAALPAKPQLAVTSKFQREICQISQIYGKGKHQYLLISIITMAVCYIMLILFRF